MNHIFNINFSINNWINNDTFNKVYHFASSISSPTIITITDGYPLDNIELFRDIIKKDNHNIKFKFSIENEDLNDEMVEFLETYSDAIFQVEIAYNSNSKKSLLGSIQRAIKAENIGLYAKITSIFNTKNKNFLVELRSNCKSANIPFEVKYLERESIHNDDNYYNESYDENPCSSGSCTSNSYYDEMIFSKSICKEKGCDRCMSDSINLYFTDQLNISGCAFNKKTNLNIENKEIILPPSMLTPHVRMHKKQNYFVQYPIALECNLRCSYCFNKSYYENNYDAKAEDKITVNDFMEFKEKILFDRKNVVLTPHGGEPFFDNNLVEILDIMERNQDIRYEFLTNGIQDKENYTKIAKYKNIVERIGFTYHRAIIHSSKTLRKKFNENILYLRNLGFNVYIKELLILDYKEDILESQKQWKKNFDIDVVIQDLRDTSFNGKDYNECYDDKDMALISPEFKHHEDPCRCKKNHNTIIIKDDGTILPCWHSNKNIGMLKELINKNYNHLPI